MELYELFGNMPMFKNFTQQEIKQFIKLKVYHQKFQKGDVIINEGDDDSSLYLLIVGTVSITKDDNKTPIARLNPGDIFGEMSFLTKKPRYSSAIADEDVLVIRMNDDFFEKTDLVMKDKIKDYFIELLISRLDRMNESVSSIANYAHTRKLPV